MIYTGRELAKLIEDRVMKLISGEIVAPHNACDKPYDSVWEHNFEWVLAKYLPDNFTLRNQVPFCGRYRCDFTISCNKTGRVWIIEYDGKTYHDKAKDKTRDAQILRQHEEVQSITRVDACTGHHHPEITRDILKVLIPECLNLHGSYPHKPYWIKDGNSYSATIFDDRECSESWWDSEAEMFMEGAPMVTLEVSHQKQPN